jgi:imidazolonepropionase
VVLIFCSDGKIHEFGEDAVISGKYSVSDFDSVIDVPNMSIIPGLIDAHTHPVWDGDRVHEFGMKVRKSFCCVYIQHTVIQSLIKQGTEEPKIPLVLIMKDQIFLAPKSGTFLVSPK